MPATASTLAAELVAELAALRRVLRRRTRTAVGEPVLSAAEAELLRLVAARPGLRVGDAAAALRLAPNTVSTLVGRLVALELVATGRDESDRRVVCLQPTPGARQRLRRWRDERTYLVDEALAELPAADRRRLEQALPVLADLVERLEAAE